MKTIKHITVAFFLLIILRSTGFTQEKGVQQLVVPHSVPNIEIQAFSKAWYEEQAGGWSYQTQINPQQANAWYNYYKATRYKSIVEANGTITPQAQLKLDKIDAEMKVHVADSYEYNYIHFWNGHYNTLRKSFLDKAASLKPASAEVLLEQVVDAEVRNDVTQRSAYLSQLEKSDYFTSGQLNYAKNVLSTANKQAIIVVNGISDAYPCWILQNNGMRTDIHVVPLSLLQYPAYRNSLKKKQIYYSSGYDQKKTYSKMKSQVVEGVEEFRLANFLEANALQSLHIALTVHASHLADFKNRLYITGLTLKYSRTTIDNISILRSSWSKMDLSYLMDANGELRNTQDPLRANYILPAFTLRKSALSNGLFAEALAMESIIRRLSKGLPQEKKILAMLSP